MMGYVLNALQKAREVVEKDIFEELVDASVAKTSPTYSNKVFIVHGHDDAAKQELEMFLAELGLEPIVLHRKADKGRTLIEKLEQEGDVGYAFILLTPDDIGYKADQEALPDEDREKERRARQNVVLEFGYFAGHLGRERVCCLHKGNVALPSDTDGLAYKPFINSIEELKWKIAAELIAAGYDIEIPKKE
jgi:predicted nucleotide-binding protein